VGYIFDISSSKTKIPSIILLLILGWGVRQVTSLFRIPVGDLTPLLPVLGTIGLILIVLEGSLELKLDKSRLPMIGKSSLIAFIQLIVLSFTLGYAFSYFEGVSLKIGVINAIPLAIISSAIAIPSARNLISHKRDFVTYESSLSDIFGVILFNFIALHETFGMETFGLFSLQLLLLVIISFIFSVALALLLSKIKHNVKFTPIILLIILIYTISKIYHLPSLVFILLFGLFIGNLDKLNRFKIIDRLQPEILIKEVQKFKELNVEMTFLIRSLFFLLFGYLIETSELTNTDTMLWALGITVGIFILRAILLKLFKFPMESLLFMAPRGLITILLFLSIPISQTVGIANRSLIIQVIILTSLLMMYGLMNTKVETKLTEEPFEEY
ncbi:MAG: hypothetical protein PHS84_08775, partial [Paludibacter sp.]|nr:hypothetical protein [Paludibacter sp.]